MFTLPPPPPPHTHTHTTSLSSPPPPPLSPWSNQEPLLVMRSDVSIIVSLVNGVQTIINFNVSGYTLVYSNTSVGIN